MKTDIDSDQPNFDTLPIITKTMIYEFRNQIGDLSMPKYGYWKKVES